MFKRLNDISCTVTIAVLIILGMIILDMNLYGTIDRQKKIIEEVVPNTDFGDFDSDTVWIENTKLVDVLNLCEKKGLFHWSMTEKAFDAFSSREINLSLSFRKMDIVKIVNKVLADPDIDFTLAERDEPTPQLFIFTSDEKSLFGHGFQLDRDR